MWDTSSLGCSPSVANCKASRPSRTKRAAYILHSSAPMIRESGFSPPQYLLAATLSSEKTSLKFEIVHLHKPYVNSILPLLEDTGQLSSEILSESLQPPGLKPEM